MVRSPAVHGLNARHRDMNAFEQLGLEALASNEDIRRIASKARVLRSMTGGEQDVQQADLAEHLLADPVFRLQQAAAWRFYEDSKPANGVARDAHDAVVLAWRDLRDNAHDGRVGIDAWGRAWKQTHDLLNSPANWQPLSHLVNELRDARLTESALNDAIVRAIVAWSSGALQAVARNATDRLADVCEVVRAPLSAEVSDGIREDILPAATRELTNVISEFSAQIEELANGVESDASIGPDLIRLGGTLADAAEPWSRLIDVFDDDPEIGEEGRARDQAALLIRKVVVAIYNHTIGLDDRVLPLAERAVAIAETSGTKSALRNDARKLTFLVATNNATTAAQAGDLQSALGFLSTARDHAEDEEERRQIQDMAQAMAQRQHVESLQMTPIQRAPGLRTYNGIGVRLYGASDYDRGTDSHVATHYFTLLWIPVFPLARYRVRKLPGDTYQFLGKVPLRSGDIWHRAIAVIAAAFIVIGIAFSANASSDPSLTNTSPHSPPANSGSFISNSSGGSRTNTAAGGSGSRSTSSTGGSPDAERAALDARRGTVSAEAMELDHLSTRIDVLNAELSSMEAQYPNGAPNYAVAQYESTRADANNVVDEYNTKLRKYQSDLASFNADVDAYNRKYASP